jgi:hypothetical protein
MVRLASDPRARQRMGEAARRRLIEGGLDWESKIDLMLGYFREAAGIPPNRPAQPWRPDGPAGAGVLATAGPP